MNNIEIWSKTFLSVYKVLPSITNSIEESTMATAIGGFSCTCGIDKLYGKMLDLYNRKRLFINIKVIVDNTLAQLSYKDSTIIKLKFIEKMKFEDIAKMTKTSIRTVFRRYIIAMDDFCKVLIADGYDEIWFKENYESEIIVKKFFDRIYDKALFDEKQNCTLKETLNDEKVDKELDILKTKI